MAIELSQDTIDSLYTVVRNIADRYIQNGYNVEKIKLEEEHLFNAIRILEKSDRKGCAIYDFLYQVHSIWKSTAQSGGEERVPMDRVISTLQKEYKRLSETSNTVLQSFMAFVRIHCIDMYHGYGVVWAIFKEYLLSSQYLINDIDLPPIPDEQIEECVANIRTEITKYHDVPSLDGDRIPLYGQIVIDALERYAKSQRDASAMGQLIQNIKNTIREADRETERLVKERTEVMKPLTERINRLILERNKKVSGQPYVSMVIGAFKAILKSCCDERVYIGWRHALHNGRI
jgi:hypothetical protein